MDDPDRFATLYGRITAARSVLAAAAEHSIRVSWTYALSSEETSLQNRTSDAAKRTAKENLRLVPSTDENMSDAHQQLPYEVCFADGGRDSPKVCHLFHFRCPLQPSNPPRGAWTTPGGSEALICNGAVVVISYTAKALSHVRHGASGGNSHLLEGLLHYVTHQPNIHSLLVQIHASPKLRICTTNIIRSRIVTVD